jgi:hypothetical protein
VHDQCAHRERMETIEENDQVGIDPQLNGRWD